MYINVIIFIVFLVAVLLYVNFYVIDDMKRIEKFDQDENKNLSIISSRSKYIDFGMINFITKESNIEEIKKGSESNGNTPYVFITPNSIDIMCNITTKVSKDDVLCNSAQILSSFKLDKLPFYFNEKKPNFVTNIPIKNESNFQVRIFDNYYNMTRRAVLLDIDSIIPFINNRSNNKPWYKITVTGNIKAMILSRPFFITINNFGLFKICYDSIVEGSRENNSFVYYNSTDDKHTFYVEKIVDNTIFPNTNSLITDYTKDNKLVHRITNTTSINIYYLMFEKTILLENMNTINSFYIHLNNIDIDKNKIINSITSIDVNNSVSSDRVNTIQLIQENPTETIKILFIQSSIKIYKELPEDFNPSNYLKYDIILSFSYDILTIVCIGKDKDNNEECFVERYSNNTHNFIVESNKKNIFEQLSKFKYTTQISSIPYLPELLVKRGYSLI